MDADVGACLNRVRRVMATMAVGAVLCGVPPAASAAVDLLQTKAAAAFKAGDYEKAAVEFETLAAAHPGDVTVLRYWAITLRKLERYAEALNVFRKALELDPDSAAVEYHLGVTLYQAGYPDAATRSFTAVSRLAPESEYAELARQYLDAIASQRAKAQRPAPPQRFGIYAQAGAQRDSNVPAAPDGSGGNRDGWRYSGYASGQYYFLRNSEWVGTVDVSGYRGGYSEERFEELDVWQLNPGVSIQRSLRLGSFPALVSARYDFLDVELDGEPYSESSVVTLSSRIGFTAGTNTSLTYRYTDDRFDNEGFDPRFSSRDADNHSLGVVNTWFLNDRRWQLDLGFELATNDAEGANFNYDAYTLLGAARFNLPAAVNLDVDVAWTNDEYPDFAGPMPRETERLDVSASVSRWFKDSFLLQLSAAWRDEESSYEALSYDRYTVGVNLSYVY